MVWRRRNAARLSAAEDALLRRCIVRLPCTGSLWRSLEASNPVRTVPTSSAWHAARLLSANKLIALHFAVKLFEVDYFHEVKIKQTVYICITPYSECSLIPISRVLSVTHIINKSASILFGSQHWRWPMLSCHWYRQQISAAGVRSATEQLHVVAAYWLSINGTDRRTLYRYTYAYR